MGKGFGGLGRGFGGLGDINKLMKQVQKAQEDMATAQEEMANARIEASSGGGAVKAVVDGKGGIVALEISPDAVDPEDVEMLQDLIVSALREAQEKAEEDQRKRLESVTGGMNLPPGLF